MSVRRCGHCKQIGHDRRTCIAFKATEQHCDIPVRDEETCNIKYYHFVGHNDTCNCEKCREYRKLNLPSPEIAIQVIKDNELAKELEKKINQFPEVTIYNDTRSPVYIYMVFSGRIEYRRCIEADDYYITKYNIPFDEGEAVNYIVTDNDFGMEPYFSEIETKNILKTIVVEYGSKEDVHITKEDNSKEAQWREAALKSLFLLQQLQRFGVQNNPNYEPIMDMIQDIEFPEHTEQDKERAGVTSEFTNVHETTGVNE